MARLESMRKMGYYPTPWLTLEAIKKYLAMPEIRPESDRHKIILLDPCCGEGDAIDNIEYHLEISNHTNIPIRTYGIELDVDRAMSAKYKIFNLVVGNMYEAIIRPLETFSLLYLNPPYDWEDGERAEFRMLKHSHKWLKPGGVLVYLVPEKILAIEKVENFIGRRYKDIQIFRFHKEDYPEFKQVVLFGVKREIELAPDENPGIPKPPYEHIEDNDEMRKYILPLTSPPDVFELKGIKKEDIAKFWPETLKVLEDLTLSKKKETNILSPIFPLRRGHLVCFLMSGVLNGEVDDMVFKAFTERKEIKEINEEENKEITRNIYVSGIRVLNKEGWYDIE